MVDIRIRDLPLEPSPDAVDVIPIDNGSTRNATIKSVVEAGRPVATQQDAEDGANNSLAMTPLTTKQAVSFQVPALITQSIEDLNLGTAAQANVVDFATAAQGDTADSAVQPSRAITAGTGLDGGGTLAADREIALNAASIASLLLADTAAQGGTEITAGTGLEGGGTLAANRTLALSSASIASLAKADTAVQPAGLTKAAVGLGNVDNTSDLAKPISTATQTALNGKASTAAVTTTVNGLMIAADKVKLNGIEAGAQVNVPQVQTDWSAVTGLGSILNKPTLGALAAKNNVSISDISATGTPNGSSFLRGDGVWGTIAGSGTVTSVGIDTPTGFDNTGPITTSGNITISYASGYQGYTTAEASKLSGIEAGAQVNSVTTVAGRTGAVVLTASDVGLGNVSNLSPAQMPVSTAQQDALDGKLGVTAKAADSSLLNGKTEAQMSFIGVGQTWQDVSGSRVVGTTYQNTTGKPIQISAIWNAVAISMQVSLNGTTWLDVTTSGTPQNIASYAIIPDQMYYRANRESGSTTVVSWLELR